MAQDLSSKRKILVTSALPYANNSLHLGHLVEYVQTDVWVRYQRLRGADCLYVCASDAHGTPTMLRAEQEGVSPEALIERVAVEHERDFATYRISVDNYLTTHAPENRELTETLYRRLRDAGHLTRKMVRQAYDEQKQMFLPDRYVRGTCPVCGKGDQYGDSCENCGATYSPIDLKDAVSVVSGTPPSVRESEHLFLKLGTFEPALKEFVARSVDEGVARKLDEWFQAGLQDWDISREAPYFGFEIPDSPGKYFYVWFDAPIGYMASFANLCKRADLDFDEYWGGDSEVELYHFIGKDIVYFHALFWPAMLSGAGYRVPTRLFVHGFLTVDGQKISKRRGTAITAGTFAEHVDPDFLRYYFAAKLGAGTDDIDLSFTDFLSRVNADLVGKLVNIASRCAGFVHRLNDGRLADTLAEPSLFAEFAAAAEEIGADYEGRHYSRAIRRIMALADRANQYIDEKKPWLAAKDPQNRDAVVGVCTVGLNLFRTLIVYLKPVIPAVAERAEAFLGAGVLVWDDAARPLLGTKIAPYEALLQRVEQRALDAVMAASSGEARAALGAADAPAPAAEEKPAVEQIELEQFLKLDLRAAQVVSASHVEGADKLLRLELDLGGERRTVFAGIRKAYEPEQLVGRLVVVVANLKPRKMRFGVSEGMILAASGGDDSGVFVLSPDAGARPGMKVS